MQRFVWQLEAVVLLFWLGICIFGNLFVTLQAQSIVGQEQGIARLDSKQIEPSQTIISEQPTTLKANYGNEF